MLKNLPPPGTKIRLLRDVRLAKAYEVGSLTRALGEYRTDSPADEFLVNVRGTEIRVSRADIEEV